MKSKLRTIINLIKNIVYWTPILKEDRWWDYSYLDRIIQHKLKQMEYNFRYNSVTVDNIIVADKLKKLIDDFDYFMNNDSLNNKKEIIELRKKAYSFIGENSHCWWD